MKNPFAPRSVRSAGLSAASGASSLAALIIAHGLAGAAHAAEAAAATSNGGPGATATLDAVVVEDTKARQLSSPKFTEPLRDTPQTIVVVPSEVYLQQGASTLSDVLRNTPGITFAAGEGGSAASTAGDAFYLRGFDASNSIFIDGVRDVGAYSRDVFNLEQVEIAKGPAGTDVGRGASSGYINLVTKTPHLGDSVAATLSFGVDDASRGGERRRATLDADEALRNSPVPGTAVRLNLMGQDSAAVGRDFARNRGWAVAPSLALGLGTPTRATLAYQHNEQDNRPDYGLPGALFPGFVSNPPPPSVDRSTYYGFTADHDTVVSDAVTARLERDVSSDAHLTNQTRYSSNSRDAVVTGPGTNVASYDPATGLLTRSRQANRRDTSILSNQTNLTARAVTGPIRHDLSAGLELSREKAWSPAFTRVSLRPIPLALPDPAAAPDGSPVRTGAFADVRTDTAALYAFDTLKLGERWQFEGGLRGERYRTDYLDVEAGSAPARLAAAHTLVTWKTGLVFKPAPDGSVYAAYGLSQKPPGSDLTLSSALGNQNNPDTAPQRTDNAEVGVKWEFLRNRLGTTLAVFRTENDRTVYNDPILGPVPAGRQEVRGAEFNATGRLADNWTIFAGVAWLDSDITAGPAAQVGAGLPLIPRLSGNLWTTWRLPWGVTVGGGARSSSQVNRLQTTGAAPLAMPSYWLCDALASWEAGPRLTLRLNVRNVFNEDYVESYNNNGGRFMPGAPRAWLLTAALKF